MQQPILSLSVLIWFKHLWRIPIDSGEQTSDQDLNELEDEEAFHPHGGYSAGASLSAGGRRPSSQFGPEGPNLVHAGFFNGSYPFFCSPDRVSKP